MYVNNMCLDYFLIITLIQIPLCYKLAHQSSIKHTISTISFKILLKVDITQRILIKSLFLPTILYLSQLMIKWTIMCTFRILAIFMGIKSPYQVNFQEELIKLYFLLQFRNVKCKMGNYYQWKCLFLPNSFVFLYFQPYVEFWYLPNNFC